MIYEIRISGDENEKGKIELDRLIQLAQSVMDIAKGSLQIRLNGISTEKGRKSDTINNAAKIFLSDIKSGSTVLELECEPFGKTLEGYQPELFNNTAISDLPKQTPVALVIESFREALNQKEEYDFLDKPLLKKLKSFQRAFSSSKELITISNRGSIPEIELRKDDFKKINILEERFPEPKDIIINGIVDELKYSKSRVAINTKEGIVNAVFSDDFDTDEIARYWGKNLTIRGRSHYQPSGKLSFVFIEQIFEPTQNDTYFSKRPSKETVEQQIIKQHKNFKHKNHLSEIIGEWPGNETIEEILNDLD
jgi:hypothetical protein